MSRLPGAWLARVAILQATVRIILGTVGLAGLRGDAETWGELLAELVPRRWRWFLASLSISIGSAGVTVKVLGQTMNRWAWWELILAFVLFAASVSGAVMAVYQYRENNRGGTIRRLKRLFPAMDRLLQSLEEEEHQERPSRSLRLRNQIRIRKINAVLEKEEIPTMGEPVNRDGYRLWTDFLSMLMANVDRGDLEAVHSLQGDMLAQAGRYVSSGSDIITP